MVIRAHFRFAWVLLAAAACSGPGDLTSAVSSTAFPPDAAVKSYRSAPELRPEPSCEARDAHFRARFLRCYRDKAFCERAYASCGEFCGAWMGCSGPLEIGADGVDRVVAGKDRVSVEPLAPGPARCEARPEHYRERFLSCYLDTESCRHDDAVCRDLCASRVGCEGMLNVGAHGLDSVAAGDDVSDGLGLDRDAPYFENQFSTPDMSTGHVVQDLWGKGFGVALTDGRLPIVVTHRVKRRPGPSCTHWSITEQLRILVMDGHRRILESETVTLDPCTHGELGSVTRFENYGTGARYVQVEKVREQDFAPSSGGHLGLLGPEGLFEPSFSVPTNAPGVVVYEPPRFEYETTVAVLPPNLLEAFPEQEDSPSQWQLDGWVRGQDDRGANRFASGHGLYATRPGASIERTVSLTPLGFEADYLDASPPLYIQLWSDAVGCRDATQLRVELLDRNGATLHHWRSDALLAAAPPSCSEPDWAPLGTVLHDYPRGVRAVRWTARTGRAHVTVEDPYLAIVPRKVHARLAAGGDATAGSGTPGGRRRTARSSCGTHGAEPCEHGDNLPGFLVGEAVAVASGVTGAMCMAGLIAAPLTFGVSTTACALAALAGASAGSLVAAVSASGPPAPVCNVPDLVIRDHRCVCAPATVWDPKHGHCTALAADFCSSAFLEPVSAVGTHPLGDFKVRIDSHGVLRVEHAAEGSRTLFSTSQGSPVELARAELSVSESQGSFTPRERVTKRCRLSHFENAYEAPGALLLEGVFRDSPECADVRFDLWMCQPRPGHLRFAVDSRDETFNRTVLNVASHASEDIYGMGAQVPRDSLNLKGHEVPSLVQEGGVGRGRQPLTALINAASPGSGGHERSVYYATPQYLTSDNRSLFLENTEYAVFDFTDPDVNRLRLYSPHMRGRVLQGSSALALVERFTEYTGRMPPPPEWTQQGAILALTKRGVPLHETVDRLLHSGVEIAGVWNQTWCGVSTTYIGEQVVWNWILDEGADPERCSTSSWLQSHDIRKLCYVNPMFRDTSKLDPAPARNLFEEGSRGGYFVKKPDGSDYLLTVTAFQVGLLDLTNPEARRWMKDLLIEEVIQRGDCSGWMADFAEALPFDAVLHDGRPAAAYHNQYPVDWAQLNREAVEEAGKMGEVLTFNRSGYSRTPNYSMMLWQGDQTVAWDKYDGIVSALRGLINGGLSGIALTHSDTGGYTGASRVSVGFRRRPELLRRWTEMNAFTSLLRTHEGNEVAKNAQVYSDVESMKHFARFAAVFKTLSFYRRQLFDEAATRGWPVVRHLMLHYPDDPQSRQVDDQFLLGSEFLVAPVVCEGCVERSVYFPPGRWVSLWDRRRIHGAAGGSRETVPAPVGEPAVFYRLGSRVGNLAAAELSARR